MGTEKRIVKIRTPLITWSRLSEKVSCKIKRVDHDYGLAVN